MKKSCVLLSCLISIVFASAAVAGSVTVVTFDDPALDSSTPLFQVDLVNNLLTGGWADSQTNLTLDVVLSGNVFTDAFFTMTAVTYTGGVQGGNTGSGTIKFFQDGQNPGTIPLVQVYFEKAYVRPTGFGGMDQFFGDGVVISGSEIGGVLEDEAFSFGFANQVPLSGDWLNGYTVTAAFTSSAVPEPATIALLGFGALALLRKRTA